MAADATSRRSFTAIGVASGLCAAAVQSAFLGIYAIRAAVIPQPGALYSTIKGGGGSGRRASAPVASTDLADIAAGIYARAQQAAVSPTGPVYAVQHKTSRNPKAASNYVGVSWIKTSSKWMARIKHDGQKHYLGLFDGEEDAAMAFDSGARQLRGQAAHGGRSGTHWWKLNFPLPDEELWAQSQGMGA